MARLTRSRLVLLPAAAALLLATLSPTGATALPAPAAPPSADPSPSQPPITLKAPPKSTAYVYGRGDGAKRVGLDVRMIANDNPFELWSTRASYDEQVSTVWKSPDGDVPLPSTSDSFKGLDSFLSLSITDRKSGRTRHIVKSACLSQYGERVRPDAPAYSPYPQLSCFANPYSLGEVQGVQAGWAVPVLGYESPVRLAPGRYDVRYTLTQRYADALGLDRAATTVATRLTVKKYTEDEGECCDAGQEVEHDHGRSDQHRAHQSVDPQPAPKAPQGQAGAPSDGPVPDLRSLPAWGISLSDSGKHLRFSATVWNAGNSPLVVDGFRREGEDEMDAYQYFFDADGNQTGYTPVGGLHWDARSTHQHWHFEDFATYTLLDKDKNLVGTSHKEAFCLANTDSVDLTVPNAAWNPYNTDLETACGEYESLSVREVLAAGWGDTYAQYRAGQSFNLEKLPNGVYYIAVDANPHQRLTEASLDNNQSLRKVIIKGTAEHRRITVPQVGLVDESKYGGY